MYHQMKGGMMSENIGIGGMEQLLIAMSANVYVWLSPVALWL